jgi:glycosyltransferase involved in cell wall biosynthesis
MTLRIAMIANFLPAPANWGTPLRMHHLARGLARIGRVSCYCRTSEEEAAQFANHPDLAPFTQVRMHTMPRKVYASIFKLFTEESMSIWMADSDPLAQLLQADHQRNPFDVLVCQQLYTANVARALAPVPWVLDASDISWMALSQIVQAMPPARAEEYRAHLASHRSYEDKTFRTATFVTCVTQADMEYVRAQGQSAVGFIRNGVSVSQLPFTPPSQRTGLDILFVGSFFWPPNCKAARFLAKEVMPRVWQEGPSARLVLCGRSPGIDVTLLQRRGIEITGTVPSVQPYLDRAAVFANALFEGAGSSLKTLEALANGVPLISTAVGVRGFALVPDQHYVAAEDADSFARAILAQLRDRAAADERAQAGRAFAEQFDWGPIGQEFAEVVARVAGKG